MNRTNASQMHDASQNYTDWADQRLDRLTDRLDPANHTIEELHRNATRLTLSDFQAPACPGHPSTADPDTLQNKVHRYYNISDHTERGNHTLTDEIEKQTARIQQAVTFAVACLTEATLHAQNITSNLTNAELTNLEENRSRMENFTRNIWNLSAENETWLVEYFNDALAVNQTAIAEATGLLLNASTTLDGYLTDVDAASVNTTLPVDVGDHLRLGNRSDNTYRENLSLVIELGGNDTYLNNAGGGHIPIPEGPGEDWPGLAALVLDRGDGDDTYTPASLETAAIGSGDAGVGVLVDGGGDEVYEHRKYIGSGRLGGGVLVDEGGQDFYNASVGDGVNHKTSIGGTLGGFGYLLDLRAGDDRYRQGGVDSTGYGFAGVGLVVDEQGSDSYRAVPRLLQGGTCHLNCTPVSGVTQGLGEAGVGLLLDFGIGSDSFDCEPPALYGCQGAGALGGFGLLYNAEGNDTYDIGYLHKPHNGMDRFAGQGGGWLGGVGVLADKSGSDSAEVDKNGTGFGMCLGVGLYLDASAGDDSYTAVNGSSIGYGQSAPCWADIQTDPDQGPGLGLFHDQAGNDTYATDPAWCGARDDGHLWLEDDPEASTNVTVLGVGIDANDASITVPDCPP